MKKFVPIVSAIVLLGGVLWGAEFLAKNKEIGAPRGVLYAAPYSDAHITENAKVRDPRFAHISFANPTKTEENFFESQLASLAMVWRFFAGSEPRVVDNSEYGAWVWTPTMQITDDYAETLLSGLAEKGINTVYLSIDSYLDIYTLENRDKKREQEKQFTDILKKFITRANAKGIQVDAEAGWRNWAENGHTYKPFTIVNFVRQFNATHAEKFRGFQYDVEPYLLDEFRASDEGKQKVLERFTRLIDQTTDILKDSNLEFSVVIPEFYDRRDGIVPIFSYDNRNASAFEHLLRVLNKVPKSSVVIMSYRNFAEGRDGSIEISKNEMRTARRVGATSRILIAQETGDFPPPFITFHNTSHASFEAEVQKLESAFSSNPYFGGIAVHYANAFIALE